MSVLPGTQWFRRDRPRDYFFLFDFQKKMIGDFLLGVLIYTLFVVGPVTLAYWIGRAAVELHWR